MEIKKERICINKKIALLIGILFSILVLIKISSSNKKSISLSSRASEENTITPTPTIHNRVLGFTYLPKPGYLIKPKNCITIACKQPINGCFISCRNFETSFGCKEYLKDNSVSFSYDDKDNSVSFSYDDRKYLCQDYWMLPSPTPTRTPTPKPESKLFPTVILTSEEKLVKDFYNNTTVINSTVKFSAVKSIPIPSIPIPDDDGNYPFYPLYPDKRVWIQWGPIASVIAEAKFRFSLEYIYNNKFVIAISDPNDENQTTLLPIKIPIKIYFKQNDYEQPEMFVVFLKQDGSSSSENGPFYKYSPGWDDFQTIEAFESKERSGLDENSDQNLITNDQLVSMAVSYLRTAIGKTQVRLPLTGNAMMPFSRISTGNIPLYLYFQYDIEHPENGVTIKIVMITGGIDTPQDQIDIAIGQGMKLLLP